MHLCPQEMGKKRTTRDGWVCFYEIAFKLGLRLPFHRIINMVLKYFNLAPAQLMPNGWRYLLGLIVLSEQLGQHIDMPIFLHFFYLKPGGEGRYAFYARRQTKLLTGAPTSDKGWKDRYFFIRKEGLFDPVGSSELDIRFGTAKREEPQPSTLRQIIPRNRVLAITTKEAKEQTPTNSNLTPQPSHLTKVSFPLLRTPCTCILQGCITLLYAKPIDPLHLLTADMGKLKVPPPTKEQLAEKDRKRKEKKSARKSRKSDPTQRADPTPDNTVAISPDVIAPTTEETPPQKRQRLSSPQPTAKGKEPMVPMPKSNEPSAYKTNLGLKDSSSIRLDPKSNPNVDRDDPP
ncbi:hypothetical protein FNV43_RR19705 [Rhamnella rubrinervis]|uniref:Transposase (putative) gypsy type domain-containing protein n=1 Tax=Rhamnella rubrinervis TaxID=2594499 RepID=A0A8K0DT61_9ROSA|nr:hypothetical protein FNV43_RR19705 [Rhamnella rubrinervis]